MPAAQLLALGERELATNEAAFVAAAARVDQRPPLDVWADVLKNHPARGDVVPAAQKAVDELQAFVVAKNLVTLPASERVIVAPRAPFDLGLASMHSSPPLEATPVKSYYYITDAQAGWAAAASGRLAAAVQYASLAVITSHEVMPGTTCTASSCARPRARFAGSGSGSIRFRSLRQARTAGRITPSR